jgi:tRNA wybutosine-synthesizing protein 3
LWVFDCITHKWTRIEVIVVAFLLNSWGVVLILQSHKASPSKRHGHSLTVVNDTVLLFGGYGSGGRLNDLWQLDPVTLSWTLLDVPGTRPCRRSHHSAVAMAHKLVIFGGLGPTACGDLWELNTKGNLAPTLWRWSKLELSKNPSRVNLQGNIVGPVARYGHTACLFKGFKMFLFGGVGDGNSYKDDLWYLYVGMYVKSRYDIITHI